MFGQIAGDRPRQPAYTITLMRLMSISSHFLFYVAYCACFRAVYLVFILVCEWCLGLSRYSNAFVLLMYYLFYQQYIIYIGCLIVFCTRFVCEAGCAV